MDHYFIIIDIRHIPSIYFRCEPCINLASSFGTILNSGIYTKAMCRYVGPVPHVDNRISHHSLYFDFGGGIEMLTMDVDNARAPFLVVCIRDPKLTGLWRRLWSAETSVTANRASTAASTTAEQEWGETRIWIWIGEH